MIKKIGVDTKPEPVRVEKSPPVHGQYRAKRTQDTSAAATGLTPEPAEKKKKGKVKPPGAHDAAHVPSTHADEDPNAENEWVDAMSGTTSDDEDDNGMEQDLDRASEPPWEVGDYVLAPRLTPNGTEAAELLKLEKKRRETWEATRVHAPPATKSYTHRREEPGWLVEHPERQPKTCWISEKRLGGPKEAEKEAVKTVKEWSKEAKKTVLISTYDSERQGHSLSEARICQALEVAALKAAHNTPRTQGETEAKKRTLAANRRGDNQAGGSTAGPPAPEQ